MNVKKWFLPAGVAAAALVIAAGSLATADTSSDSAAGVPADFKLPEGWTMEDMQACMIAGTPGEQHKRLAEAIGKWETKCTMWMSPESEPVNSEGSSTVEEFMDGRYVKCEMEGEMPSMGPYRGFGLYGFDNVSQRFVAMWVDNHSTGIAHGNGELSDDGKVLTWTYTANCPITKKPVEMREVETKTGPHSKVMEMFGVDPKSGKEFKMMHIDMTRKS
jgi:hypothetical protein